MKSYEDQVREQVEQYRDVEDIHALPGSFHDWSHNFLLPGFRTVFDASSIPEFFAAALIEGAHGAAEPLFMSLGCGDGSVEISVAQALHARGMKNFKLYGYDISDVLISRFQAAIPPELSNNLVPLVWDLNAEPVTTTFHGVMANHSLHHMVELEAIFATVYERLAEKGVFAINDMIGRNGHQRWPETRLFLEFFWPMLTERQRRNAQLARTEAAFLDHDCATEGFEGVRAQDILPLILRQGFHPARFLGVGGVVDPIIDRAFGHGFHVDDPDDLFLLRRIAVMNEILLDLGAIKPTMALAWFTKTPRPPIHYRNRSAENSVRDAAANPDWLAFALQDFARSAVPAEFLFRGPPLGASDAEPEPQAPPPDADLIETVAAQAEHIRALQASTSWRVTAPLRWLSRAVRRFHAWPRSERRLRIPT